MHSYCVQTHCAHSQCWDVQPTRLAGSLTVLRRADDKPVGGSGRRSAAAAAAMASRPQLACDKRYSSGRPQVALPCRGKPQTAGGASQSAGHP